MTVKIMDEIIKESYQSHQNVDNSISQGANISLFRNTKHSMTVTSISKYLLQPLYTIVFHQSQKLRQKSQTHFLLIAL